MDVHATLEGAIDKLQSNSYGLDDLSYKMSVDKLIRTAKAALAGDDEVAKAEILGAVLQEDRSIDKLRQ